ncbi:UNVERIFIED_CONTAM: hypothetical protein K2H54_040205 [Gekko kuhli]
MDLRNLGMLESFSSGKAAPSMSRPLKTFYRGEPMALGITQIFTGILEIAFGLVIDLVGDHYFYDIHFKTPFWTGILYIISGSLSVAAAKNPKIPLVKGALGMNVVSTVAAGVGMVFSSLSMTFQMPPSSSHFCGYEHNDTEKIQACHEFHTVPYATMYNTVAILLMLAVLEFVIAIVTAAFGCATICRNTYSETVIRGNRKQKQRPVPFPRCQHLYTPLYPLRKALSVSFSASPLPHPTQCVYYSPPPRGLKNLALYHLW